MPLQTDDELFAERITDMYRSNSLYNRRFEQRRRLKERLGKQHRKLIGEAKYYTKRIFLGNLTRDQARAIRRILKIAPGAFWRAAKGKRFLDLPKCAKQLELPFTDDPECPSAIS